MELQEDIVGLAAELVELRLLIYLQLRAPCILLSDKAALAANRTITASRLPRITEDLGEIRSWWHLT